MNLIIKYHSIKVLEDHIYGIILEINKHTYFAPLSSPKSAHKKYFVNPSYMNIGENEDLGIIRFNNMIPVNKKYLTYIDFNTIKDRTYKKLLEKQNRFIQKHTDNIRKQANLLYRLIVDKEDLFLKRISCNFKLLEEKCKQYTSKKQK